MNKPSKRWQAVAGYVVDLYRFARARLENPHSYYKFVQLNELRRKTSADFLIETGTYLGVTSYRCSRVFNAVHTIEIEPSLAASAARFLEPRANVRVHCGEAIIELPSIFDSERFGSAVIFLDGHFSGGDTGSGRIPEPAIEELRILAPLRDRIAAILIDDFRSFGAAPGFPLKSELLRTAEQLYPEYMISIAADQVIIIRKSAA